MAMITQSESDRLKQLESVIRKGRQAFVEVGNALLEIRETKLYKATHGTFARYVEDRFGFTPQHAGRICSAAEVASILEPIGSIPTESQAREVAKAPKDKQAEVVGRAVEIAADRGKKPTAAIIAQARNEVMASEATHDVSEAESVDDGEYEDVIDDDDDDDVRIRKTRLSHNSGENEWHTPKEYIDSARAVMGCIDCDPASSEIANKSVGAAMFYTKEDDGLGKRWLGNVWLNPPYAQPLIAKFAEAVSAKYESSEIVSAVVLVNNATETVWFQRMASTASAVCLPKGRIRFLDPKGDPKGTPLQGQAILYFGAKPATFNKLFRKFGPIALFGGEA